MAARRERRAAAAAAALGLALGLAGCTIAGGGRRPAAPAQPTEDMMPSAVLDHQDPGADTSHNPERLVSSPGSPLDGLFTCHGPEPAFGQTGAAPHYYQGCGGCASHRAGGLLALVLAIGLTLRRRRRRA